MNVAKILRLFLTITALSLSFTVITHSFASQPAKNHYSGEIVVYNWEDDLPQQVLEAFTRETGVNIRCQIFKSQEEAVASIESGAVYDVAVIDGRFISRLSEKGLLKRLDYENLLNFRFISPNFRGLAYDPDNRYSVPYSWGTTGLLVNTGIAHPPIRKWADLWNDHYAGKVAISVSYPREAIGMTLKSLGFSANTDQPEEIEAALGHLLQLRLDPDYLYRYYPDFGKAAMTSGTIAAAIGFSGDLLESHAEGLPVEFILPEEGLLLWADTFVVPDSSRNQATAELFIDFLLRPEISAEIVNQKYYASANEAAQPHVKPEILANKAIYPTDDMLRKAEIIEAVGPKTQQLLDRIWQRFLDDHHKPQ